MVAGSSLKVAVTAEAIVGLSSTRGFGRMLWGPTKYSGFTARMLWSMFAHCAVQIIDPQCLLRLNVIESNLVGLDVSFPADFLGKNHEGSK